MNDAGRGVMAAVASWRDDVSGLLVTGGTSTAYTVTTNQGLPATPNDGQMIAVSFHTGNGATPTLQVDGGLAFPIQTAPGIALPTGTVTNTSYQLKFKSSASAWVLFGAGIAALAENVAAGSVINAGLANMAAWTIKLNNTNASAAPQDVTIDGLTAKTIPVGADEVPIWDVAGAAMKKATLANVAAAAVPLRGYLGGLTLSGGGSQTITIAAGEATSDDATTRMTLGAFTKTFSNWAVGSGNGGLTGVVDVLLSTSATAPTLPTNYTKQRRIGSIKTDAGPNIISFFQNGDTFLWSTMPALDVNTTLSSTAASATVQTPLGVRTEGIFNVEFTSGTGTLAWLLSSLDIADTAPGFGASPLGTFSVNLGTAASAIGAQARVWTNTSAQIRHRGNATDGASNIRLQTIGWVDPRGRFN